MRVLIVGAGPTGLTCALELARRGIDVHVVDRKENPSVLSRAVGILPRSLDVLDASGVSARLLDEGVKIRHLKLFRGQRPLLQFALRGGHPRCDYVLALAQDRTEAALRDALVGVGGSISYGHEMIGLREEGPGVVAALADGTEHACDYLVGADGVRSTVRTKLEVEFPGIDLQETWSIADVDAESWPHSDALTLCLLPHGVLVVVAPLETQRFRVISNTPDALATLPLDLRVTNQRRSAQFTISIRQAARYAKGHVYLAGDAAHCHSPAGGRGMNLGIADAADLAERISGGNLEAYSTRRHAEGAATITLSERMRKVLTSPSPVVRGSLRAGCALVNLFPALQRQIAARFLAS